MKWTRHKIEYYIAAAIAMIVAIILLIKELG